MLAPIKVINPRVMNQQNPQKDQRQRKKFAAPKTKPQTITPPSDDGAHIDLRV